MPEGEEKAAAPRAHWGATSLAAKEVGLAGGDAGHFYCDVDLSCESPRIIVPRHSHSDACIELKLGSLSVRNTIQTDGAGEEPTLDLMRLNLQQLTLTAPMADGSQETPLLDPTDFEIELTRRLDNSYLKVTAKTPSSRIQLLMPQIESIFGILTENYGELPDSALGIEAPRQSTPDNASPLLRDPDVPLLAAEVEVDLEIGDLELEILTPGGNEAHPFAVLRLGQG